MNSIGLSRIPYQTMKIASPFKEKSYERVEYSVPVRSCKELDPTTADSFCCIHEDVEKPYAILSLFGTLLICFTLLCIVIGLIVGIFDTLKLHDTWTEVRHIIGAVSPSPPLLRRHVCDTTMVSASTSI